MSVTNFFITKTEMAASVPLMDDDDDTIQFGEEDLSVEDKRRHPYVAFFHVFFRTSAIVVYILSGLFNVSFIGSFVTVILLLSMDFWTVKNISGRLLVGLRWWNYVDEQGDSHWVFESRKGGQHRLNSSEARTFWLALVLVPGVWVLLFIVSIFRFQFQWLLLVGIALVLSGANLYAYIKCRLGSKEPITSSLSNFSSNFLSRQLMQNVASMMSKPKENSPQGPTSII